MQTNIQTEPPAPRSAPPGEPDSETASLLRSFMIPAINGARSWSELSAVLEAKGFAIVFRHGKMIFKNIETGRELCTGAFLGTPLRELAARLGRPSVRADADGVTGRLVL